MKLHDFGFFSGVFVHNFFELLVLKALWACIVLSVAAASISFTITQTELFVPVRNMANKIGHMTGYLFHCFYCMSHWVVFAGVLIYRPVIISSGNIVVDLVVTSFFTVTLTTFINGFMFRSFINAMEKMMKERELKEIMAKEK
ncbi:DUF1360 domain-containing protein [Dickeya fangzhongdai]|uniref:DUF1360 domain-containing protein n=1 Tax=Dickeya fangzhongdai TaxID=1778540 RepID=UPI0026E0627E|nr:DUF1360 domain-containing protein [Dickeya fangzhongdai]WKV51712.1 DUF1360 domain-containing protein [Dickeya fangzhongdai]